ncbi:MAG: prepilin-type N-terminal cleavage/methylation domain-containing protein [Kandleria vitulina]|uniref:prepilin-type N-terminal cleavage/methylation domain-containing protein n=1 Tax=Kandleria vitulina TaxID=1630 RepID=UPI002E78DADF|nr:prepilin-type N-terminal cleavage/methylation domain-containing protein [Kandleria vitulina]MEE0988918.1 prepilin-type N-terminal cleavage/methylation domain-containing protein [Kandleria vitulina]
MVERMKGKKGFTLIEIIVVIVILAVLMAVAVPSVMQYTVASKDAKYEAGARAVFQRVQYEYMNYYMEHGKDPTGENTNSKLRISRSKFKGVNVNHIRIHVTADHNVDALSATIYPDDADSDNRDTRNQYHDRCIIFRIDTNKKVRIDRKWSTSSPILLKHPYFEVMITKD